MSILKGFGQIAMLIDNDSHVIAPVGEMSMDSKTFALDQTIHTHSDYPGVSFIGMQSLDDSLQPAAPINSHTHDCLKLIHWVNAKARSGEIGPSQAGFNQLFNDHWSSEFVLLTTGTHVASGTYYYPGSISVCRVGREGLDNWTIWFSDQRFQNEYDDTILFVIPPIPNLDQFFNSYQVVQGLVDGVSREWVMDQIELIRGQSPFTVVRSPAFDWTNPLNIAQKITTYWTIIIYGKAGDNPDRYKEAIIDYVQSNSARSIPDWAEIFPDIFRSTEVIIAPTYHVHAVPDSGVTKGLYSPIATISDSQAIIAEVAKGAGYTATYARANADVIPTLYRSLSATILAGPENRPGFETFRAIYWDYVSATTTQNDFMRMREKTRRFAISLNEMLLEAEKLTPASVVPAGFNRVERDGIWYLSKTIDDLLVLVTSKYSILAAAERANVTIT